MLFMICLWKSFVENKELTRHFLTDKEVRHKTMKCDICDYCTDGIASLNHHKKIHYPAEKTFDCNKCDKVFRSKPHLQRHCQTHNVDQVKAFKCFICEKCFQEKYNLKQHIDSVHHDIQKFTCNPCGKSFKSAS